MIMMATLRPSFPQDPLQDSWLTQSLLPLLCHKQTWVKVFKRLPFSSLLLQRHGHDLHLSGAPLIEEATEDMLMIWPKDEIFWCLIWFFDLHQGSEGRCFGTSRTCFAPWHNWWNTFQKYLKKRRILFWSHWCWNFFRRSHQCSWRCCLDEHTWIFKSYTAAEDSCQKSFQFSLVSTFMN